MSSVTSCTWYTFIYIKLFVWVSSAQCRGTVFFFIHLVSLRWAIKFYSRLWGSVFSLEVPSDKASRSKYSLLSINIIHVYVSGYYLELEGISFRIKVISMNVGLSSYPFCFHWRPGWLIPCNWFPRWTTLIHLHRWVWLHQDTFQIVQNTFWINWLRKYSVGSSWTGSISHLRNLSSIYRNITYIHTSKDTQKSCRISQDTCS